MSASTKESFLYPRAGGELGLSGKSPDSVLALPRLYDVENTVGPKGVFADNKDVREGLEPALILDNKIAADTVASLAAFSTSDALPGRKGAPEPSVLLGD